MSDALVATNICRAFNSREVLKNFSLTLASGAFEVLMGASGSGKSTFLQIAGGLLAADSGTLAIDGACVTNFRDDEAARFRRRHVGIVFQNFNLLNDRTVEENILLPLALDGRAAVRAAREDVRALVDRLGLTPHLSKKPDQLSGGEQQRVALARALAIKPAVILADEPTGNLDRVATKEICELLADLHAREKCTILVVTHDPFVAACAEKVHLLREGAIVATCDAPQDAEKISRFYLENEK